MLSPGAAGQPDAVSAAHPTLVQGDDGILRAWYEAYDGSIHSVAAATSADGVTWRKWGRVLAPGGPGSPDEQGLHRPYAVRRGDALELWYTGAGNGGPRVLRAVSRDGGASWTKQAGAVDLHLPEPLQPGEALHLGSVLVEPGGLCRVYFERQRTVRRRLTWGEASRRQSWIEAVTVRP